MRISLKYCKILTFYIALLLLGIHNLSAQSNKVDSIIAAINNHPKPDSIRVNYILYLPSITLDISYAQATILLKEAIHITDSLNLPDKKGKAYYYMGKLHASSRERDEAVDCLQKAIKIFEKTNNVEWLAHSHMLLGFHQSVFYQYESALQHSNTALALYEKLKMPELMIEALNQAATVYKMQREYSRALECYTKIAAIADGISNIRLKQTALKSMGDLYQFLGDYDKAVFYFSSAISVAVTAGDIRNQFYYAMPLSDTYLLQHRPEEAKKTVMKMLEISNRPQNQDRYALGLNVWTELLVEIKEFNTALYWLDSLMNMSRKTPGKNNTIKGRLYKSYGDVYRQTGNYVAALLNYDTAIYFFRRSQVMILAPEIYKSRAAIYKAMPEDELIKIGNGNSRFALIKNSLEDAIDLYDTLSSKVEAARVKKELAIAYANEHQYEKAYHLFTSASAITDSVGDNRQSAELIKKLLLMDEKKREDSLRYNEKLSQDELVKQKLEYEKIQQELEIKDQTLLLMKKQRQIKDLAFLNAQTELQIEKLSQEKLLQSDNEKAEKLRTMGKEALLKTAQLQNSAKEQANVELELRQHWLYSIIALLVIAFFSAITYHSMRLKALGLKNQLAHEKLEQEQKEKDLQNKINEATQAALRSQMNPHFIFNVLNSINKFVLTNEPALASKYLIDFSKLMRLILENSKSQLVVLNKDIEALRLYMQMEKMRFIDKFDYSIIIDPAIDPGYLKIPPLLIQPFVENAIWHGIMQKQENDGLVTITIGKCAENMLLVTVVDNGIGRKEAELLKSQTIIQHKSFGLQLTQNRIDIVNKLNNTKAKVQITDLEDENGKATGTSVTIEIPI